MPGFLDLGCAWDTSPALVMAGAIAVGVLAFFAAGRRTVSLLGAKLMSPTACQTDRRQVVGSVLFGIGWRTAGF